MTGGHLAETPQTGCCQRNGHRSPVARTRRPLHHAFTFKLVGNSCYVAAGDHQPFGKFTHAQSARIALQLGHQVKSRKGRAELTTQTQANFVFNAHRAGEHPQPQTQSLMVALLGACLQIKNYVLGVAIRVFAYGRSACHSSSHITSPPAIAIDWPVMEALPGRHSHVTALATSSGSMMRFCGLRALNSARASVPERPVLATMASMVR